MNIANKLTVFRIALVPFFVVALMVTAIPHNLTIAFAIFVLASLTDFLDGYIARSRNMVTNFGKFLDPIADKILVMAALVCFAGLGWIQSWIVVVILARDFIVNAIRLAAVESEQKLVIPARSSGKVKTIVTMLSLCGIMFLWVLEGYGVLKFEFTETISTDMFTHINTFHDPRRVLCPIANSAMYICVALTVFSGVQYAWDARKILKDIVNNK
jgi:CDP-diacylglycerol--glycerol-3-phosphate 3-phosphatidyltransferase